MITITFGFGGVYSKLSDALAAALPPAYENWETDYEFVQVGYCFETSACTVLYTKYLNGHSITIRSDTPHNGDPTAGHLFYSEVGAVLQFWGGGQSGAYILRDMNIQINYSGVSNTAIFTFANVGGSDMASSVIIERCIIIDYGSKAQQVIANGGGEIYILGCKLRSSSKACYANSRYAPVEPVIIECTTCDGSIDPALFANHIFRDCYATNFARCTNALGYTNRSEDAMPTFLAGSSDNVGSIVPANEFKSTTYTDAEWMFLKDSLLGTLGSAGTIPVYVSQDIAGNAIPNKGNYPVGCHISETSVIFGNNYVWNLFKEKIYIFNEFGVVSFDGDEVTLVDTMPDDFVPFSTYDYLGNIYVYGETTGAS